jgi:hypothetical protein
VVQTKDAANPFTVNSREELVVHSGQAMLDPQDPVDQLKNEVVVGDALRIGNVRLATINDFVWHDLNGNGIQDAGEPGINDITVNLLDSQSNVVRTTTTSAGGLYGFTDLLPGDYQVEFVNNSFDSFTQRFAGVDDTIDSNADPATGLSELILMPGFSTMVNWATLSGMI